MRVKDFPNGVMTDESRMLFDNEETGTHSVDMATLKQQFGGGGGSFSGSIYDFVDEMTKDGGNLWLRRSVVRGKNLGTEFTDEQKNAIADGSFKGLFLGDYWQDNYGYYKFPILDFDYWYGDGVTEISKHHLVLGGSCGAQNFYNVAYPVAAYGNSKIIQKFKTENFLFNMGPFSSSDFTFTRAGAPMDMDDTGTITEWDKVGDVFVCGRIPNQHMIFGRELLPRESSSSYKSYVDDDIDQLAMFKIINFNDVDALTEFGLLPLTNGSWLSDFVNKHTGVTCYIGRSFSGTGPVRPANYQDDADGSYTSNPTYAVYPIIGSNE